MSCVKYELETQKFIEMLGITIADNLKWNELVENIVKMCSARLPVFRIVKPILSKCQLRAIYVRLVD